MKLQYGLIGAFAGLTCAASVFAQGFSGGSRQQQFSAPGFNSSTQQSGWSTPWSQNSTSNTVIEAGPGLASIKSVKMTPSSSMLKNGDTITVTASGPPGQNMSFTIDGITKDVKMMPSERIGEYKGTYKVTDKDAKMGAQATVVLTGANGDKAYGTSDAAVNIDGVAPIISNMAPVPQSMVHNRQPQITAIFNDGDGSGIDAHSVRMWVNDKDVTHSTEVKDGQIMYTPKGDLSGDNVKVHLRVADKAKNITDYNWTFAFAKDQ
jgi:hypothetical protein